MKSSSNSIFNQINSSTRLINPSLLTSAISSRSAAMSRLNCSLSSASSLALWSSNLAFCSSNSRLGLKLFNAVIIGYCDTVGEWHKCHNNQVVTILNILTFYRSNQSYGSLFHVFWRHSTKVEWSIFGRIFLIFNITPRGEY